MIGRVYKISSEESRKCYIGSTKQTINERFSKHKHDYKRYNNGTHHYVSSYEVVKYPDAKIELLEEVECDTLKDLRKLESKYILDNDCVNCVLPARRALMSC